MKIVNETNLDWDEKCILMLQTVENNEGFATLNLY
jgi:hypothetical protein